MPHPPPPPPPAPPGHMPPHWAAVDSMPDEDVLRFAPPEIRRVWRRVASVEAQLVEMRAQLDRIEALLRAQGPGQP